MAEHVKFVSNVDLISNKLVWLCRTLQHSCWPCSEL